MPPALAAVVIAAGLASSSLSDIVLPELDRRGFAAEADPQSGDGDEAAEALDLGEAVELGLALADEVRWQKWRDDDGRRVAVVVVDAGSSDRASRMMSAWYEGFSGNPLSELVMGSNRARFDVVAPDGAFGVSFDERTGRSEEIRAAVSFRCNQLVFHVEGSVPTDDGYDEEVGARDHDSAQRLATNTASLLELPASCDTSFDPLLRRLDTGMLISLLALGAAGVLAVYGARAAIRRRARHRSAEPDPASARANVVDVSGLRRRLVAQSLLLTASTVTGFAIVAVRWALDAQDDGEIDSTFGPVVQALAVSLVLRFAANFVGRGLPIRIRATSRVWSGRRRALTFVMVGVAGLVWMFGLLLVWGAAVATVMGVYRVDQAVGTSYPYARHLADIAGALVFASILIVIARAIYVLADRVAMVDARRTLDRDDRPPILLLRAFDDDEVRIRTRRSARHRLVDRYSVTRREPFERLIAGTLRSLGPVVAIADPRRQFLRPIGAAREVVHAPGWREVVSEHMEQSALNVVVLGQGEGLRWEIETILAQDPELAETVFVIPPVEADSVAVRWSVLAQMIDATTDPPSGTVAVRIVEGNPLFYDAGERDGVGYEVGLVTAARDVVGDVDVTVSQRQLRSV